MKNFKAYLYLTLAMTIVGSSLVVGKIVTSTFPVFLASCLSLFVASVIFIPLLWQSEGKFPKLKKKDLLIISLQALIGTFLYRIFLLYGLRYINAAESGIITSTTSAAIAVFSYLLLREQLKSNKILGVIFSVMGVLVINIGFNQNTVGQNPTLVLGVLLIFASVIAEALFSVLAKFVSNDVKPTTMAAFITIFSFFMFLPFAIYEGTTFDLTSLRFTDWLPIFYYGAFVTVISFSLWFKGLAKVEASTAGIFLGIVPVSSVVLSYIILRESFSWSHIAGALFVIIGILLISKEPKYAKK